MVGAFPSRSPAPFAHSDAYRFRAPDFALERLPRGHASSIGSGSDVEKYIEMIESFAADYGQLSEFSVMPFPAGPAGPMSVVLGDLVDENPTPGVSSQLVLCPVGLTETRIYTVESPREELTTPPLASTSEEFRKLCSERGLSSAAASARVTPAGCSRCRLAHADGELFVVTEHRGEVPVVIETCELEGARKAAHAAPQPNGVVAYHATHDPEVVLVHGLDPPPANSPCRHVCLAETAGIAAGLDVGSVVLEVDVWARPLFRVGRGSTPWRSDRTLATSPPGDASDSRQVRVVRSRLPQESLGLHCAPWSSALAAASQCCG